MTDLAHYYPTHVSAHLPASLTSHAITSQEVGEWVEQRDQDVRDLHALIAVVNPNRHALSVAFDAFFHQAYPEPTDVSTSHSEIAMRQGFQQAKAKMVSATWDEKALAKSVDGRYWQKLIDRFGVDAHLSYKARTAWENDINTGETPDFTLDNVLNTLQSWVGLRAQFFIDRVETVWEALSREHKTNQKSFFGSTLILPDDDSGVFHELRQVVATTLGRPPVMGGIAGHQAVMQQITCENAYGVWHSVDGNAFEVKVYRKGTVHIRLHPETAAKMNDILAMKYPLAIADTARNVSRAQRLASRPLVRHEDMLSAEVLSQLYSVRVFGCKEDPYMRKTCRIPDDAPPYWLSCPAGMLPATRAVLTWFGARFFSTPESECAGFDYPVGSALKYAVRVGTLPNIASYQFYPTRGDVGEMAAETLHSHLNDDGTFCYLEPQGGHGDLAAHLPKSRTQVVELSAVNARILAAKGYQVENADFLAYAKTTQDRFDGILSNPPFRDQQAYAHTATAMDLLKARGVLVAILPASARQKLEEDYGERFTITHTGPYTSQFEGTEVVVEVVTVRPL